MGSQWKVKAKPHNAPEVRGKERPQGLIARDWLRKRIVGKIIMIATIRDKKGKYGRYLAEIFDSNCVNLNEQLVKEGLAVHKAYWQFVLKHSYFQLCRIYLIKKTPPTFLALSINQWSLTPLVTLDYQNKRPMEVEEIYWRPLKAAEAKGVEMPVAKLIAEALDSLNTTNQLN